MSSDIITDLEDVRPGDVVTLRSKRDEETILTGRVAERTSKRLRLSGHEGGETSRDPYGFRFVSATREVPEPDATPAPLDPKQVHVGDTVTVRFIETGEVFTTTAYQPEDVTKPGEWVYILGWPLNKPMGHGLAITKFEILDHQPAPEPEVEWKPGEAGTATVDGYVTRVMRTDGIGGADAFWVTPEIINGTRAHKASSVSDFVPDEARPLPTRDQVYDALLVAYRDEIGAVGGTEQAFLIRATTDALALLRGESR